jgi:phosphatidate phosphatase APP1
MRRSLPLLLLLALWASPQWAQPTRAGVEGQGFDAIAAPGSSVAVRAKFEVTSWGGWWRPDLRLRKVTFTYKTQTFSRRTGLDGIAELALRAPKRLGLYTFAAKHEHVSVRCRLWVLDPKRPLVVADIDGTISTMKEYLVPFLGGRAKAYSGSPQLLRDLARTHQVVYLTARDEQFDPQTRAFLARHRFPDGPVIYNDLGLWTSDQRDQLDSKKHGAFKLAQLQRLQQLGLRVALGIGNAETDAQAYESAKIPSYIRTEEAGTGPSYRFTAYSDLRARLARDGHIRVGLSGSIP